MILNYQITLWELRTQVKKIPTNIRLCTNLIQKLTKLKIILQRKFVYTYTVIAISILFHETNEQFSDIGFSNECCTILSKKYSIFKN